MKAKKIKLLTTFLLLLTLSMALLGAGCDDENEYSDLAEGYVVGSFIGYEDSVDGQGTENKTPRGYCILLEGSENNSMDFYTFNFPDTLFSFPDGVISSYNTYNCGPAFFPDSLKYDYKIVFKYQIVDESDEIQFTIGPCFHLGPEFLWKNYDQVIVTETAKN